MVSVSVSIPMDAVVTKCVNYSGVLISRRQGETNMRKLIAMALESAERLKLGSYNIAVLEDQGVSPEILDILSSSLALEPAHDVEKKRNSLVARLSSISALGEWAQQTLCGLGPYLRIEHHVKYAEGILDVPKISRTCVDLLYDAQPATNLLEDALRSSCNLSKQGKINKSHQLPDAHHFQWCKGPGLRESSAWSDQELGKYSLKREEAALDALKRIQDLKDGRQPRAKWRISSETKSSGMNLRGTNQRIAYYLVELLVDAVATALMASDAKIILPDCTNAFGEFRRVGSHVEREGGSEAECQTYYYIARVLGTNAHLSYRAGIARSILEKEIRERLPADRVNINEKTNILRLRAAHIWNKRRSQDESQWKILLKKGIILCSSNIEIVQSPAEKVDIVGVIADHLAADRRECDDFREAICSSVLGVESPDSNCISRMINRRRTQLFIHYNDRALVIPYLNIVILDWRDKQWETDFDLRREQMIGGVYKQGPVRRAANILLALSYSEEKGMYVHQEALNILREKAREGKLYIQDVRQELLSKIRISHRVPLRGLREYAKKIFPLDPESVASLTREMVHDRLCMDGNFGTERFDNERDCYFQLIYRDLWTGYRNNVEWGPGVPMLGLQIGHAASRQIQFLMNDGKQLPFQVHVDHGIDLFDPNTEDKDSSSVHPEKSNARERISSYVHILANMSIGDNGHI